MSQRPAMEPAWMKDGSTVLEALGTTQDRGLEPAEAARRLAQYGRNELQERGGKTSLRILWEQFSSTMVLILIAAAILSALLGKPLETAAISAIIVLFALLGFVQEYRAEQAMAALKRLAVPVVRVRRGGALEELSARDLVPGDIVLLEAGSSIPADLRLIESANLRVQEAALTGESEPVEKQTQALAAAELPLGDRKNMAYMGTFATYGRGIGVVTATGMDTELGRIAELIQSVEQQKTPLQQQLDTVGKQLALLGITIAVLLLGIGMWRGEQLSDMILTAISVAVAVVPEGLPAVVTITLALGAQRMLRRRALIRKLPAVETLGSVTTICSDKTGTLTQNRMTVTVIDVAGYYLELVGTSKPPAPALTPARDAAAMWENQPLSVGLVLAGSALCNDASLQPDRESGRYLPIGDPTEGALLVAALQAGLERDALEHWLPRVAELPFDSDRKRMTTVHRLPADPSHLPPVLSAMKGMEGTHIAFTKGSVDGLLEIATQLWMGDHAEALDAHWRQRIAAANEEMAMNGMRVIGIAFKRLRSLPAISEPALERDL
ncbi:MAG TPA: HAD-IC family P-type ATPase, partial [Herpetosiphonaceae bacterium]